MLQRLLESGVSSAGSDVAQEVVKALAQGQNLWASDTSEAVASLSADARGKYNAAVGRGINGLINLVEEVILRVMLDPAKHKDLRVPLGKRKRGEEAPAPTVKQASDLSTHASWRYVLYREVSTALQYSGNVRVPLPTVVEVLIKVCFPGPLGQSFTFFTPSAAAPEEST